MPAPWPYAKTGEHSGGGASFANPGASSASYGFNNGQCGSVTVTSIVR